MSHVTSPSANVMVPKNGWRLFLSLAKGQWQPGQSWHKTKYRHKFFLRSLLMPFSTAKLLNNLALQPALPNILTAQPGLPCRLHRPYLALNFSSRSALDAICFHYEAMTKSMPDSMFRTHFTEQGYCLAELEGKNDTRYFIDISAFDMQGKEGEIALNFCDEQRIVLAKLTFTFCQFQGRKTLFIGGLQGAKPWVPHESIQLATKACHGLFPKRLLLETATRLAELLSAEQILAVGNQTHIFRSWRYERKKKDVMHADYDSFWLSMGGELRPDGLFLLPEKTERKSLEEVVSKKRAEYRRRYQLTDSLLENIGSHFQPQAPTH